ncbi:hypothetical protein ACIBHY_29905 [Nonomuraea sp. NPDC050547]|uniref:hypothetical protein n=1 Tax=Nonomuraea sp. NPDC050547 TaxID=3364368 RepID=UPI00379DF7B7
MRFRSLFAVLAVLLGTAVASLLFLVDAARASIAETGQITAPTSGSALTTGKLVTVKAVITNACTGTITLRNPAGGKTSLATESGNPNCLGDLALTGTFTPDTPGDYTLTLIGSVPLSEVTVTAAAPTPTATPTVTETITATPTPSASASTVTPTPTATVTKTVTPKPSASPTKSAMAKPRPIITTTKIVPSAPITTGQQPTVINNIPAMPTTAPTGTDHDPGTVTFPTAAAPVTTVTAQPDYAAAWVAFQNMSAANKDDGSIWDAILRVIGILAILAGISVAAWFGFKTYRKRGNHH